MRIEIRRWRPGDETELNQFSPHPQLALWWWAHPTVVAELPDGALVGYASFTLSLPPTRALAELEPGEIGWGQGLAVHPAYHGHGIGRTLVTARADLLRSLGCRTFLGHAAPGNAPMRALFTAQGLTPAATVAADDGTPVMLYMGAL